MTIHSGFGGLIYGLMFKNVLVVVTELGLLPYVGIDADIQTIESR